MKDTNDFMINVPNFNDFNLYFVSYCIALQAYILLILYQTTDLNLQINYFNFSCQSLLHLIIIQVLKYLYKFYLVLETIELHKFLSKSQT